MAVIVATSTSSESAGKLTIGRKIWSRVPNWAGSFWRSELDHFRSAVKMASTRSKMVSRSARRAACSFVSFASSASFFLAASFTFWACMNSSFAMAFFFCSAREARCCLCSSMASFNSCSLKLSLVAKCPSPFSSSSSASAGSPPPCKGWHKSLTRSTARVLHWASSAWNLAVRGWMPRPRPAHFRSTSTPRSAQVYRAPPAPRAPPTEPT
mmetsp:Transcript_27402/g.79447  ORF Transcript_27402/g.79447 Transcript_27402/m.79447 type:complete len:211 (+) Transcript_27402:1281-1913(+)